MSRLSETVTALLNWATATGEPLPETASAAVTSLLSPSVVGAVATTEGSLPTAELNEFAWGVDLELTAGKPIQIMRTGTFQHPEYGKFSITPGDLEDIVQGFNANVRGQQIPIDVDHLHEKGAVGWMKSLQIQDDKLFAVPEWNEDSVNDIANGKYKYFSPHFGPWEDPESRQKHRIVLMSGAVTNFPFLKHMEPISLSEVAAQGSRQEGAPMPDPIIEATETPVVNLAEVQAAHEKELAERDRQLTEMRERMARMERDGLVRRLSERIHGHGSNTRWVGNQDEQLTFMVKLAETFGEDSAELKHYTDEQDAHAVQVRSSSLFTEIGTSGDGAPATALAEFSQKRDALVATGLSLSEATARVATENPALYNRYDREQNQRAKMGA